MWGNNYVANLIHLNSTENAHVVFIICEVGGHVIMRRCEDSFGVDDIVRFMVYKGIFAHRL